MIKFGILLPYHFYCHITLNFMKIPKELPATICLWPSLIAKLLILSVLSSSPGISDNNLTLASISGFIVTSDQLYHLPSVIAPLHSLCNFSSHTQWWRRRSMSPHIEASHTFLIPRQRWKNADSANFLVSGANFRSFVLIWGVLC